jgi:hypothetical protein
VPKHAPYILNSVIPTRELSWLRKNKTSNQKTQPSKKPNNERSQVKNQITSAAK